MRSYEEPVYAFLSLSFWLVISSLFAWSKAHRRLQKINDGQNKVAYAEFSPVFKEVFWQLGLQIFRIRVLLFVIELFVSSQYGHSSSYFAARWTTLFWPDMLLLSYVDNLVKKLPNVIQTMTIAIPYLLSYFLAALATIVAFLMTLNYGRNRYMK